VTFARVVALDAELATAVFGVFADEVARWQRERAHEVRIAAPATGCVLEIQRFAYGARLYPHAHALVPEVVFVAKPDGDGLRFVRRDPPDDGDVARVVSHIEKGLTRVLGCWRATRREDGSDGESLLPACAEVRPTEREPLGN
jgi:hypothetical protein